MVPKESARAAATLNDGAVGAGVAEMCRELADADQTVRASGNIGYAGETEKVGQSIVVDDFPVYGACAGDDGTSTNADGRTGTRSERSGHEIGEIGCHMVRRAVVDGDRDDSRAEEVIVVRRSR